MSISPIIVHAGMIRPGVRVATIPGPGREQVTKIDVADITSEVIEGTTIWTLHDGDKMHLMNMTGNYWLIDGVTVALEGTDADGDGFTEFVALPSPTIGALDEWWAEKVFPETTGDDVDATIVGGPRELIGQTFEWNDN